MRGIAVSLWILVLALALAVENGCAPPPQPTNFHLVENDSTSPGRTADHSTSSSAERRTGPNPTLRRDHRVAQIGDVLYVVGGQSLEPEWNSTDHVATFAFDWVQFKWRWLHDLTLPMPGLDLVVIDGQLLAAGETLQRYHPDRNEWEVVGKLGKSTAQVRAAATDRELLVAAPQLNLFDARSLQPVARVDSPPFRTERLIALVSLDNRFHALTSGPNEIDGERGQLWARTARGDWIRRADAPFAFDSETSIVLAAHDRLFIFSSDVGMTYDPSDDTWTGLTPLPEQLVGAQSVCRDGLIHVIGGAGEFPNLEVRWAYDLSRDCWFSLPNSFRGESCLGE